MLELFLNFTIFYDLSFPLIKGKLSKWLLHIVSALSSLLFVSVIFDFSVEGDLDFFLRSKNLFFALNYFLINKVVSLLLAR